MNVGLPGAGIGGLFYLLCALTMPFKELFLSITRPEHQFRHRLIAVQLGIVAGIILGIIAIYKLLGGLWGIELTLTTPSSNLLYSWRPILVSFSLLSLVLVTVRLIAYFSSRQPSRKDNKEPSGESR